MSFSAMNGEESLGASAAAFGPVVERTIIHSGPDFENHCKSRILDILQVFHIMTWL